jgi:hypothetical protein
MARLPFFRYSRFSARAGARLTDAAFLRLCEKRQITA